MTHLTPAPDQLWCERTGSEGRPQRVVRVLSFDGHHNGDVTVESSDGRRSTMRESRLFSRYEFIGWASDVDEILSPNLDPTPLFVVRDRLATERAEGTHCPACDQYVKVYRRKLTAATGAVLIRMHHHFTHSDIYETGLPSYTYLPSLGALGKGADTAKARYWGLIEAPDEALVREDGSNRVGYWRLTELGHEFVLGREKVPAYALIYDGRLLELDDSQGYVTIRDVLGTKFRYDELMQGV